MYFLSISRREKCDLMSIRERRMIQGTLLDGSRWQAVVSLEETNP